MSFYPFTEWDHVLLLEQAFIYQMIYIIIKNGPHSCQESRRTFLWLHFDRKFTRFKKRKGKEKIA